jgi:glycosyltransferase involved in cell wall biosynthesis
MKNTENIRVSYLITTRNRAQFLQRTLDNVREFITPEDELLVIDGGSTDGTLEILEKNRDVVSFYLSEPDKCEAHAFNKGLFRARGRYIKPITDDDYLCPDAIRRLVSEMEADPDIDVIVCGGEVWRPTAKGFELDFYRRLPLDAQATPINIFTWAHHGLGMIVRKTAFELVGGAAGNYTSVDGDIFVRLIECGCSFRYLDLNLYKWYLHPHSGIFKRQAFYRDALQIAVRLNQWERVLCPPALSSLLETPGVLVNRDCLAAIYGAWIASLLARIGLGGVPILMGLATKRVVCILKKVLHSKSSSIQSKPQDAPNWTGQLRGPNQ